MAKKKYDDSSIVSITSDRERVITRPTTFVPTTDVQGAMHIFYEIIDNAIDEVAADQDDTKKANTVNVIFNEKTKELTVTDNGRGIPQEKLLDTCTVLYTTAKLENSSESAYEYSGG